MALTTIVSLCIISVGPSAAHAGRTPDENFRVAANARGPGSAQQYIVRFGSKKGLDETVAADTVDSTQVGRVWSHALNGFVASLSDDEVSRLENDPDVLSVERDSIVEASSDQSNPPWGLDRIDQQALPLSNSYSYGSTGSGVTAYIVDSGIRTTHTEFTGRILPGWSVDFGDGRGIEDCNGHGTHVAGIIGGTTYGVAKGVSLVPVRVLPCNGGTMTSTVIAGLDWIIADHAAGAPAVANMSLGGEASAALDAAVNAVIADGVTVVIAAGNEARNTCRYSLVRVPAAITVGASERDDWVADYSNFGSCNDLFAPGSSIQSAWDTSDTAVATMSGTSMAAPHVAGAVARILQESPWDSPADVWAQIDADATIGMLTATFGGDPNKLIHLAPASSSVPCAPYALLAVSKDSEVALSWSAPFDSGFPVTDYVVQYRPTGGPWSTFADGVSTATSATVTGLVNGTSYDFQVAAVNTFGTGTASKALLAITPSASTLGFIAVPPVRVFDTRPDQPQGTLAVPKVRYGGADLLTVKIVGFDGVPSIGAGAVSLNVTVVDPIGAGFVTVYPCGDLPPTSSLNYTAGETVANSVITPLSPDGEVCFYSSVDTHLVADLNGWFANGSGFAAVDPARVFDTRPDRPQGAVPVAKGQFTDLRVKLTGAGGVPPVGAGAVSLNVTVVDPVGSGYVTVYPCGDLPPTSSLNYTAGETVPNAVITPLSPDGDVCFYSSVTTHLIADVNGWFATESGFTPLAPRRVFDTRADEPQGEALVAKQQYGDLRIKIAGIAGVPLTGVGAVSLNVTVVDPVGAGYVTVYPCGDLPPTSSLNYTAGEIVPNAVIAPISPDGEVCFYSYAAANLLADVNGWYSTG